MSALGLYRRFAKLKFRRLKVTRKRLNRLKETNNELWHKCEEKDVVISTLYRENRRLELALDQQILEQEATNV